MLRNIFVFLIITIGVFYAAQGPFYALLLLVERLFPAGAVGVGNTVGSLNLSLIIGVYLVIAAVVAPALRITSRTALLFAFFTQTDDLDLLLRAFRRVVASIYRVRQGDAGQLPDLRAGRQAALPPDAAGGRLFAGLRVRQARVAQLILNPGAQNNNIIPFRRQQRRRASAR